MTFPSDLNMVTVTGFYPGGDGNPLPGRVMFIPSVPLTDATGHAIIPAVPIVVKLNGGRFTVTLLATDNANISPQGWYWIVTECVAGGTRPAYNVLLPHTPTTVDLASLVPVSPGISVSTLYGVLAAPSVNTWQSSQVFTGSVQINGGLSIDGVSIANPPGDTTHYLRADGTWATVVGSGVVIDTAATDIQPLGTRAAGAKGQAADAAHVHPTDGLVLVTRLPLGLADGGTGGTSQGTARAALGLGGAAVVNIGTVAGTAAAGDDARIVGAAQAASLGSAATKNVGTASGTVAAGDDARFASAAQKSANLSDLTNIPLARATLGLNGTTTRTGVLAEVISPALCSLSGGSPLTAAVLILNLIRPGPVLATNLGIWLTLAGLTASGVNGLALFDESGNLIDQTGDMSTAFGTAGFVEAAMGATHQLTADTNYYIGVLTHYSGTTPKAGAAVAGQAIPVIKGHYMSLTKSSTASFPASFTPSTLTTSTATYCMTIS